jgi:cytochrome c peroxidase
LFPSLTVAQTIGNWPDVAVPPGNPITPDKILLGKALFFEEQLSADDTMACATCHLPEAGGGEARPPGRHPGRDEALDTEDDEFGSSGVVRQDRDGEYRRDTRFEFSPQSTGRNSPSVYGAAFYEALFWDRRAGQEFRDLEGNVILPEFAALETQAVAPLTSPVEMANEARTWAAITTKLAAARPLALAHALPAELAVFVADASYGELFARVFGSEEITRERIAMALATFERILVPDQTPFDLGTMTSEQELGFQVFRTRGSCTACHFETNRLFTDGVLHGINLPGHSRVVKTPNLRNVGLRRRLMSSGQFTDLDQVVSHYEEFGFFHSPLKPDERRALLDFLGNALTDKRVLNQTPPFDRPKLRSELEPFGSNLYGEAWPGTGGVLPELIANTPASLGNANFKIGVVHRAPDSPVFLVLGAARTRPGTRFRGVPLHVSLAGADILVHPPSGTGERRGVATFRLPLPADPSIIGLQRYAQGFVLDPNALGGLAATPGAQFLVF